MMLLKIAWRNIWRSKMRSFVVITAIALGLWAGVFASAFVNGMMKQKIDNVIRLEMSHFQVHHPQFRDEFESKYLIENGEEILDDIKTEPDLYAISGRVISNAMIGSANSSGSIKLIGIDPEIEAKVTEIDSYLVEGKYFEGVKRNPIYISTRIAEKYKVKLRSKLILTVQDSEGEIVASSFRVAGIFNTKNGMLDKMNVYVRDTDLRKLMNIPTGYHEIAVFFNDHATAEPMAKKYTEKYKSTEILPWMDLSTGMRFMVESMDIYTIVLVGIILLALLFSIVNTMLMAVLDRTQELGVLMAIGLNKTKIFFMIMIETILIALIGGPLGLLLSLLLINYFGTNGIDLGSSGYDELGFATIIFPYLSIKSYLQVTLMVFIMSVLAAIYPAIKALSLKPVEAIRKI